MTTPAPSEKLIPRKSRLGRAYRRRRRKEQEILAAEEEIRRGGSIFTSLTLPTDRSATWPAAYEHRKLHSWTENDEKELLGQLGYIPGNAIRIPTRVSAVPCLSKKTEDLSDKPVVVQLYPIVFRNECNGKSSYSPSGERKRRKRLKTETTGDEEAEDSDALLIEPFPTLYWLTHPLLRILVSRLEVESFGTVLQKRLEEDPSSQESMKRAGISYGKERHSLISESDWMIINERGWEEAFSPQRGVSGSRNHCAVKCLHAHAAHFLSGRDGSNDNKIGLWVMEEVEKRLKIDSVKEKK